jgi:hypothetical protein
MNEDKNEENWIVLRDDEPVASFKTREKAIGWLKSALKQTLSDFDKQDKPCEYDYNVEIKKINIRRVIQRKYYLGI